MEAFDLRHWCGFVEAGGDLSKPAIIRQVAIDSRRIALQESLFIALPGSVTDGHRFVADAASRGARYALIQRDASVPSLPQLILLRVDDPLRALQEIATCYREERRAVVIGVTGSVGKTMVKDLLASLLAHDYIVHTSPDSFNSQIGVALSLLGITDQHSLAVIEAGVSKPGEMEILRQMICPDHVIITTIGDQHLATLGSRTQIAREKSRLASGLKCHGWLMAPAEREIEALVKQNGLPVHWWEANDPSLPIVSLCSQDATFAYQVVFPDGFVHNGTLPYGVLHHIDLLKIGCKAAWILGANSKTLSDRLTAYRFNSTRTEVWQCDHGIMLINSPPSTDPQSIELSLRHLAEAPPEAPKVFVFGGMKRGTQLRREDMTIVIQAAAKCGVKEIALYGAILPLSLKESIQIDAPNIAVHEFSSLEQTLLFYSRSKQGTAHLLLKGPDKRSLKEVLKPFAEDTSANVCSVNLTAIAHNIETVRHKLPQEMRLMVMVKALAYGTDNIRIAKFLRGCGIDILGVSFINEGLQLKRRGISQAIFSLNALPAEAPQAVAWDIEVGVSEIQLIDALAQAAADQGKRAKVHLHIDTGMGRLGCRPEQALAIAQHIHSSEHLILEGVMTHLAAAEDPEADAFTAHQYATFESAVKQIRTAGIPVRWYHAANSSGALRHAFPCCNMARIGLAMFGLHSSAKSNPCGDLRLALSLTSQVSGINTLKQGETVGYGRHYIVQRPHETIAIVPLGYFDGFSRQYSGCGHVIIRGQKARYLGKICMDYLMVDVTDIPDVAIGDDVLIFGHNSQGDYLAPEELASGAGSVAHELIACLGPRIKRLYIYE